MSRRWSTTAASEGLGIFELRAARSLPCRTCRLPQRGTDQPRAPIEQGRRKLVMLHRRARASGPGSGRATLAPIFDQASSLHRTLRWRGMDSKLPVPRHSKLCDRERGMRPGKSVRTLGPWWKRTGRLPLRRLGMFVARYLQLALALSTALTTLAVCRRRHEAPDLGRE
jgi:hypothetical protein